MSSDACFCFVFYPTKKRIHRVKGFKNAVCSDVTRAVFFVFRRKNEVRGVSG